MSAPRKPREELRVRQVPVNCTDAELDALHELSRRTGKPIAELLRSAVHSQYPADFPPVLKVRT